MGLIWIFHVQPSRTYIVVFLLLIYSAMNSNKIRQKLPVLVIIAVVDICFAIYADIHYLRLLLFLLDFPLLYLTLEKTVLDINLNYEINAFYFVLNFYVLTLLIKNFIIFIDLQTGIYYFYITSALEIFISLYFVFYNEKNSFRYKLNSF